MVSIKSIIICGIALAYSAVAAPTIDSNAMSSALTSPLEKRKHDYKYEVHIHIDTGNDGALANSYTEKYRIDVLDKPGKVMGYDFNWQNPGTWGATNPNYQIKMRTTYGPEVWIDGVTYKRLLFQGAGPAISGDIRSIFTISYASQHFNGVSCENWAYYPASQKNRWRKNWDI